MKRSLLYSFLLLLTLFFFGCHSDKYTARRLQRQLVRDVKYAEAQQAILERHIEAGNLDSICLTTMYNHRVQFYVYNAFRLIYWSDNNIAGRVNYIDYLDRWRYYKFENMHTLIRLSQCNDLYILAVIPIKRAYVYENEQLRNRYMRRFHTSEYYDIAPTQDADKLAIHDIDGRFLFSIYWNKDHQHHSIDEQSVSENFSYQQVLTSSSQEEKTQLRVYVLIALSVLAIIIGIGVGIIIRANGWKNLRLHIRFQLVMVGLLVLVIIIVFFTTVLHIRAQSQENQREQLEQKTQHIQKALQYQYFFVYSLNQVPVEQLNIVLRDISFSYETDIHIYDLAGQFVGSSSYPLFEKGILSRHLAPDPIFLEQSTITRVERLGDMSYLSCYTELVNGNSIPIGYIAVPLFISNERTNSEIDAFIRQMLPIYIFAILVAALIAIVIASTITRPLRKMSDQMQTLRIDKENAHISYPQHDEIGELVERYNDMVDQLAESAWLLAKSEREMAWRTMARQIMHEINNSLTPMKLSIQQLQFLQTTHDARYEDYFNRTATTLISEFDHLSHIATAFSTFAKQGDVKVEEVDVAKKLFDCIVLHRNNTNNIPIRYIGPDEGILALADEQKISDVFANLISNAIQAIGERLDGQLIVQLSQVPDGVDIDFMDNGCGISSDIQDKVFEPNFTTKDSGMGLGLAICRQIVEGCRGSISFTSSPQGTTFFIHLKNK